MTANRSEDRLHFRTLQEIYGNNQDLSYQKVHRALAALRGAELVVTWAGPNNEQRMTIDAALRVERLLTFMRNQDTIGHGVERLRSEIQQHRIESLEEEIKRLRALVEVRPPWWTRAASALRQWWTYVTRPRRRASDSANRERP